MGKQTVCFTGTCPTMTRDELTQRASEKYDVLSSVTKNLDILVCADPNANSTKLQKAAKNGTKIISYDEFIKTLDAEISSEQNEEKSELKVELVDKNFEISGTFDFGYIGKYTDSQIEIGSDIDEVKEWDIVKEKLSETDLTEENIVKVLQDYVNEFQNKILKNKKLVNNDFLVHIFYEMAQCENEFWEIEGLATKKNIDEDEVYDSLNEFIDDLMGEYSEKPNDGSIKKSDVESIIRKKFKVFNLDFFLKNIKSTGICFNDGTISFQCSDNFGCEILCEAYDELDEKLAFTDWHNF